MGILTGGGTPAAGGGGSVLGDVQYHLNLGPVPLKQRKKQQAPQKPQPSGVSGLLHKAAGVASSVGHSVTDKYKDLSTGLAESAAFGSHDEVQARHSYDSLHQANVAILRQATAKIKDPTVDPAVKQRYIALANHISATEGQVYKAQADRLNQTIKATDPKKGAADVAGIGLDVLTAGHSPISGGTAGLKAGRLGKVGEAAAGNVGKRVTAGAVEGGVAQGGSSVAQQEATTGKVNKKQLAEDVGLGAVLGGIAPGLDTRKANKVQDTNIARRAAQSKKDATVKDLVTPPKTGVKLLGAGRGAIQKRIDDIDKELSSYSGSGVGSKFQPETKTLDNLGTDSKVAGSTDQLKFNKNRTDGNITTGKGTTAGTVAPEAGTAAPTKSASELRGMMRERKQLQDQLDAVDNPKAPVTASKGLSGALSDVSDAPAATAPKVPAGTFKSGEVNNVGGFKRFYRKAVNSVDTQLRKDGASDLADGLQRTRDFSEVGQAAFIREVPTVTQLDKREFKQFVDHLEASSKGVDSGVTNPKVLQAADEWNKAIPKVRDAAKGAGIDVGDLGPNYFPRNYQQQLNKRSGFNKAVDHLVKTGQAKNAGEARQQLRYIQEKYNSPFGHFEHSRTVDLPDYDKSKNALVGYVGGAFHAIGHAKEFGAKGEKAQELIAQLHGKDPEVADRAFKNYLIGSGHYDFRRQPELEKAMNGVRSFNRLRTLGLSAILNAGQTTNTATVAGVLRTARAATRVALSPKERDYVHSTGVILDSVLSQMREQQGVAGKVTGKLTAPGFNTVERFNRAVAAEAGKTWAGKLAKKASGGNTRAEAVLRDKLGVTGNIGRKLTPEQEIQASRELVKTTQFKVDPQDLPGWMSSPEGKMVAQFRTFTYKQTGFMFKQVLGEAKKGNFLPLTRFLAVGVPVGYAEGAIRDKLNARNSSSIKGVKPEDQDSSMSAKLLTALGNVGAFGVGGDIKFLADTKNSPKFSEYATGTLAGATAGYAVGSLSDIGQASAGSPKGLERRALKTIPVVGSRIAAQKVPYNEKISDKQVSFVDNANPEQKQAYYDFFNSMEGKGSDKKKVAAQVKAAVKQGDNNRAQRIASEHNAQVDEQLNQLRSKTNGLPDNIDNYVRKTYKINYQYYESRK